MQSLGAEPVGEQTSHRWNMGCTTGGENGIDLIRWNDEDRIVEFKVWLRPLKAINLVREKMAAALQR